MPPGWGLTEKATATRRSNLHYAVVDVVKFMYENSEGNLDVIMIYYFKSCSWSTSLLLT